MPSKYSKTDKQIIKNLPYKFRLAAILFLIGIGVDMPWLGENTTIILLIRGTIVVGALLCSFLCKLCSTRSASETLIVFSTLIIISSMALLGALEKTYLTGYTAAIYQTLAFLVIFMPIRTPIFIGLTIVVGFLWFLIFPAFLPYELDVRLLISHVFGYLTYSLMSISGNYLFIQVWKEKEKQQANLEAHSEKMKEMANRDGLTGVYNFRNFQDNFPVLLEKARSQSKPVTLCLFDLDNFKSINDTYGHVVGNAVLQHFSNDLRATMRSGDAIFRIGGDEFAVILPGTNKHDAYKISERLLAKLESTEKQNGIPQFSCSIGIAEYSSELSVVDVIESADRALYKAKEHKDTQICMAPGD